MIRDAIRILLMLCALFAARTTLAEPLKLDDGTTVERWTLPNGLEVVTRDVPGSRVISVAWGYRIGLDHDPADQPGLASLLAEAAFTAQAGETPERTRGEMASLRPQGWSLRVTRRQTLFNETGTTAQFPGLLHQVAGRMRGVTVTDDVLREARATVRRSLAEKYLGTADQVLYWRVREHARGLDRDAIDALAAAKGLDRETPASVQRAIARAYVPANGVLVLAGDLSGLDLRSILAGEFGSLPAGERLLPAAPPRLDSVAVVEPMRGVDAPVGVLGLESPALTDTLHPSFFMSLLVLGGQVKISWGDPDPPLVTRFQYSLLDDPTFARFYPPVSRQQASAPRSLAMRLTGMVDDILAGAIPREVYDGIRHNMLWMMGGPMPPPLVDAVRRDPAALNVICTSLASQALWGNEVFWAGYRRRFDASVSPAFDFWADWLRDPAHLATLLLVPER